MSMTYSLFEWVRESLETLLEKQPETIQTVCEEIETKCSVTENDDEETTAKTKVKKEQLTKAQKRAQWKKGGVNEEDRERGWNWVDIVRHLSQTRDTDQLLQSTDFDKSTLFAEFYCHNHTKDSLDKYIDNIS